MAIIIFLTKIIVSASSPKLRQLCWLRSNMLTTFLPTPLPFYLLSSLYSPYPSHAKSFTVSSYLLFQFVSYPI